METDPVTFARDQTADRLADRFEDTDLTVETRPDCPGSVFLSQASNSDVLVIGDRLDDLGRGVSVQKLVINTPENGASTVQVYLEVDTGVVSLQQAVAHLEDEFSSVRSDVDSTHAEATIEGRVSEETFLSVMTEIRSTYDVQINDIAGWQTESWFKIGFVSDAD